MGQIAELSGKRVYLDTNIFIYALEDYPEWHEVVTAIFDGICDQKFEAFSSELILTELLVKPLKTGHPDLADKYKDILESQTSLPLCPVNREVLIRAAVLRAGSGLRTPDAIHLATALNLNCDIVLTNDKRIKSVDGIEIWQLSELS